MVFALVGLRKVWAKDVLLLTILILGITTCELADLTRWTSSLDYHTQNVYQRDSIDGLYDSVTKSTLANTLLEYTPHNPILINGDSEFNSTAQAEGWLGNGTTSNPFVISGLEILTSTETAISILGR